MAAVSRKTFEDIDKAAKPDAASPASQFPTGIIDRWKANENYRSFLLNMKINGITSDDAVVLIKEVIDLIAKMPKRLKLLKYMNEEIANYTWMSMQIKGTRTKDYLHLANN